MSRAIVCLGDSLSGGIFTNGFPIVLQDLLNQRQPGQFVVRKHSAAGASVDDWLSGHLSSPQYKQAIAGGCAAIILLLGTNDARLGAVFNEQQFCNKLRQLVQRLMNDAPGASFFLAIPTPLADSNAKKTYQPQIVNTIFPRIFPQIAASLGVTCIDCFSPFGGCNADQRLFGDGVHPSPEGDRLLASLVCEHVMGISGKAGRPNNVVPSTSPPVSGNGMHACFAPPSPRFQQELQPPTSRQLWEETSYGIPGSTTGTATAPQATDFSGTYVDNTGGKGIITQSGSKGKCVAETGRYFTYQVVGDTATMDGSNVKGKIRSFAPRVILWSNGLTYQEVPTKTQAMPPSLDSNATGMNGILGSTIGTATAPQATDFSGTYVSSTGAKVTLTQSGSKGECNAETTGRYYSYQVVGDTATIDGSDVKGKFRSFAPRVILWSNGHTYQEAPTQTQAMPPSLDSNATGMNGTAERFANTPMFFMSEVPPVKQIGEVVQSSFQNMQGLRSSEVPPVRQVAGVAQNSFQNMQGLRSSEVTPVQQVAGVAQSSFQNMQGLRSPLLSMRELPPVQQVAEVAQSSFQNMQGRFGNIVGSLNTPMSLMSEVHPVKQIGEVAQSSFQNMQGLRSPLLSVRELPPVQDAGVAQSSFQNMQGRFGNIGGSLKVPISLTSEVPPVKQVGEVVQSSFQNIQGLRDSFAMAELAQVGKVVQVPQVQVGKVVQVEVTPLGQVAQNWGEGPHAWQHITNSFEAPVQGKSIAVPSVQRVLEISPDEKIVQVPQVQRVQKMNETTIPHCFKMVERPQVQRIV
jgi:lysophospholipase L1-like esterase